MNKFLLTAATFLALTVPASAAKIGHSYGEDGKGVVTLTGLIEDGDFDKVGKELGKIEKEGHEILGIALNSPGGSLNEGVRIARGVNKLHLTTILKKGSSCASACFIIFAAGPERVASDHSAIGVHSASDEKGKETEVARAATLYMARLLSDYGVPHVVLGHMIVTEAKNIFWLKQKDIVDWNVKITKD